MVLGAFRNVVRVSVRKNPPIWWALVKLMQCSGDTSGEDRIRTDDLLTASQEVKLPNHLIFKHLKTHKLNVCQKCVKNECQIS